MKFEIKSRWTGNVQITAEIECDESAPTSVKLGLSIKWAFKNKADLRGADLRGAYLGGADLGGADLRGADLRGAYLGGADLGDDIKIIPGRSPLQLGPIGSRSDWLLAFNTTKGTHVRAGCFFGPLADFEAAVLHTHGDSEHGQHYRAATALIRSMWPDAAADQTKDDA